MCVSIYTSKCNMKHLNNDFNKFKMNDLIQVNMLIIQNMWENSINHSNIIIKHWTTCVSIYYNKCKMQFMSNGLNHIHMLIIEKMWKKSLIHSNINVKFLIVTHVLINYGK
jgi:hypothetical protein